MYNMRYSKLNAEEILKVEQAVDNRRRSRNKGYSKMKERDAGVAVLNNGAVLMWPSPPGVSEWVHPDTKEKITITMFSRAPEGMFRLKMGQEERLFDAEEFRRHLRWV